MAGQVRVVVVGVVMNATYPVSLKHKAKESKLRPSTTGTEVVCERPLRNYHVSTEPG